MTVAVHHWSYSVRHKPRGVGHVALSVVNSSGSRYLSWYPASAKSPLSLVGSLPLNHSKAEDEASKGQATETIIIDGLDEAAIIGYIDRERPYYSLFGTSCAQTVADALRAGTGGKRSWWNRQLAALEEIRGTGDGNGRAPGLTSYDPVWTPLTVADLAREIQRRGKPSK